MILTHNRNYKSFTAPVTNDAVANFIVLTGVNGSGKSTLLEAIQVGAIGVDGINNPPSDGEVRLFKISELLRQAEPQTSLANYQDNWANLKNRRDQMLQEYSQYGRSAADPQVRHELVERLVNERVVVRRVLEGMETTRAKSIVDFDLDDFRETAPLISGAPDFFSVSISEIFLSYHGRVINNKFARFAEAEGEILTSLQTPLSDLDFIQKFGAPPWETLNETLSIIGLGYYSFIPPEGLERNIIYEPMLKDARTGVLVKVDELSSGERTLLTVALTLYSGTNFSESFQLPKVLLLDEADASLHPSMVGSLLKTVKDIFHDKYGIKVILTTHSPSTVALAPENSLYVMQDSSHASRLIRANSADLAMKSLTVGIPTMNVSIDERRQVFVESEIDAYCHDKIYALLRPSISTAYSLTFIPSGKAGAGSSNAVRHLVNKLSDAGVVSVRGIYDRDERSSAPKNIHFAAERYSLENFVLDPLALGLFLIREGHYSPGILGLPEDFVFFNYSDNAQLIVDYVLNQLRPENVSAERVTITYSDGTRLSVDEWYLNTKGHELEARIKEVFSPLNRYQSESSLKYAVVDKIYSDLPKIIPASLRDLYVQLSS